MTLKMTDIKYLDTVEAYDKWAQVYDTDGNFLQKLDDLELTKILPQFLQLLPTPVKLIDLGCGTGRNTIKLLDHLDHHDSILGLDPSAKMLDLARERCRSSRPNANIQFEIYNILNTENNIDESPADAIVSTLVLEHVPVTSFFSRLRELCMPQGYVLITNMHSEMGAISQAGFKCPETGIKYRPESYPHTVDEVVLAANDHGFELIQDPIERAVKPDDVEALGPRSEKWVGVMVWFCVVLRRRRED